MYHMNLALDPSLGTQYKSMSQKARVITESWVENEMFCPSCDSSSLERLPHGTKVRDFQCTECLEEFQCKSMSKPISNRILDSEYSTMIGAIMANRTPNLMLLHYSRETWQIQNLMLIPGHFLTISAIEKRNPLRATARRARWIGCNILLDSVPNSGLIFAVRETIPRKMEAVRAEWGHMRFLRQVEPGRRGWLIDVLTCLQSLEKTRFTLQDAYHFERRLSRLHPDNKNVKPKIRQQLQILRDKGVLRFASRGVYEFLRIPSDPVEKITTGRCH